MIFYDQTHSNPDVSHFCLIYSSPASSICRQWVAALTSRSTLQDTELKGYFIPKHTRVLSVTWAVDHDTRLWGNDVYEYRPERFLSQDGSKFVRPEYAIPFSIGTGPLTRSMDKQFEKLFAMIAEMKAGQEEMKAGQEEMKAKAGQKT
ncbi:hypothetical protein AVEN_181345-1 [Araneus ventricosus]|uniref:Uncharacterized protein n=1 Tax=Araneus ventricosus TaxID=182803 RepID=A0A4Y2SPP2_ARAVE|nr:hypothetical protein AVEN_181345-1 [Araneus ventricosus]